MKRNLLVIFGYLMGSVALVIPWFLTWFIGNGKIPPEQLTILCVVMWAMYIIGVQIITWNADIELRILRNKVNESEWDLQTGKNFNKLIDKNPISEEELLSISETVCKFVALTRVTDINKFLFDNDGNPRRIR